MTIVTPTIEGSGGGPRGVVGAYDEAVAKCDSEIIAFIHSDVKIYDDWVMRVEAEFADPGVAIVGLGGALGMGTREIYKTPYRIEQLQRIDYYSNMRDWKTHGKRETGARDVAVVDGFFMAVRTAFLKKIGGWSWFPFAFHSYDTSLCLMARRHGYRVRMVGVECDHFGGGTSTSPAYREWCKRNGTTMALEHSEPHKWQYDFFRDVLPLRVK